VPHCDQFVLLDRLTHAEAGTLTAEVDLDRSNIMRDSTGRVPAYVGIEYIAQTIAALAGLIRWRNGLPPRIGLLLGCHRYSSQCTHFPLGTLQVQIEQILVQAPIAVFSGDIRLNDGLLAEGEIKAIQPDDDDLERIIGHT